jgi:hypothetical protein
MALVLDAAGALAEGLQDTKETCGPIPSLGWETGYSAL